VDDDNERIVKAAAKLIAAQIREMESNVDVYPEINENTGESQFIPKLLKVFMKILVASKLKQNSIGECIVQAARPRTILAPIPLSLGIEMHHLLGSKYVIRQLNRLGFSTSYDEVLRYKQSSVMSNDPGKVTVESYPQAFTQWVADNVDHNVRTLDGYDTFHGMGIISASVSISGDLLKPGRFIPRLKYRLSSRELIKGRGVPIVPYHMSSKSGLAKLSFCELQRLRRPTTVPPITTLNLLWHVAFLYMEPSSPRTNWSGYMQESCRGSPCSPASIQMLPLIDLNPSDETCIYSTLLFVQSQAKQLNIVTPCITFDQPPYVKAVDICTATGLDIVCRLGGFHTLMSFLGSIGNVMAGSGLEEILKLNYGSDTVSHMLSGKAVSRAIRGHFLVQGALMVILLKSVFPSTVENSAEEQQDIQEEADKFHILPITKDQSADINHVLEVIRREKLSVSDCSILDSPSLSSISDCLIQLSRKLVASSRTAKLWLNYIHYIDLVQRFITAERTGNWHLHLDCTYEMLNLFAATGHSNYAKSARLYLQMMTKLPETHPWLYEMFLQHGFHSVRRSGRYWAGLSTDLLIEQTMMRSLKSRGGLTRGSGFEESVRMVWVLTMHQCASIHLAMSTLTGLESANQQHADVGISRATRDCRDLKKVLDWLEINNPFFSGNDCLRSLSSGLVAGDDDNINCDSAEEVGEAIQKKWNDRIFSEITSKKADQVRTLRNLQKMCIIGQKPVLMDANSLFHRLVILVERSEDIPSYFSYELTPIPTALFKDNLMRKADKPALAKAVTSGLSFDTLPSNTRFVLDGGCLLHKIRWVRGATYYDIAQQYVSYVLNKYGVKSVIVFDGYLKGPSCKDHEHKRRMGKAGKISADVLIDNSKPAVVDQQSFLANETNKSAFIELLRSHFQLVSIETHQSDGDADTDIVGAALRVASRNQPIGVVANDTDILILLLYHVKPYMPEIYFVSEGKKSSKTPNKYINIHQVQKEIGQKACQQILVIHAFGGCDTVSSIFGHGKGIIFKKITGNMTSASLISILQDESETRENVANAGLKLMVMLYGGKASDDLNRMRYASFCRMAATSLKRPQPDRLPPTERATYYHALRTHLQAVVWKTMNLQILNPKDWGWKEDRNTFTPVMTDKDPAPDNLLNIIRCKCKSSCASALCSCKKNGLSCVTACSNCHGEACSNTEPVCNNDAFSESESDEECDGEAENNFVDEHMTEILNYKNEPVTDFAYDSDLDWCREETVGGNQEL